MDKAALLRFSQTHPWHPVYSEAMVKRFLDDLVSSDKLVFDVHDENGLAAVAVLIDKITNPAGDANLEVLGLRPDVPAREVLPKFFALADRNLPAGKSGFQTQAREGLGLDADFYRSYGLSSYYSSFEMENPSLQSRPLAHPESMRRGERADAQAVFNVLKISFAQNPETSIPDEASWVQSFATSPKSHYYLRSEGEKLIGFAHLLEPAEGDSTEVRTLGVLVEHRGKSVGRDLLQQCLNESLRLGYSKTHLSVAAANERALSLYESLGFKVTERYNCYRKEAVLRRA